MKVSQVFQTSGPVAAVLVALGFSACAGGFVPTPAAPVADIQTASGPVVLCLFTTCSVIGTIVNQGPDCASSVTVAAISTESGSRFGIQRISTDLQTVGPLAVGARAAINVCCFTHTYPRVTFATRVTSVPCR
jgi:hypothetical protein